MFGKLFGRGSNSANSGPVYRPYKSDSANHLYNLQFCDNLALLNKSDASDDPLSVIMAGTEDRETLERIGNDLDADSRVRMLAFNRLRAMNISVPRKRLLGTIIEVPQQRGLDVLSIFIDGRLRYINQSEKFSIFEATPPELAGKVDEILRASQFVVNRYGPWDKPRRPPPKGDLTRMSFLASDGLYLGEGRFDDLMQDRFAAPVMRAASELVNLLVDFVLEMQRRDAKA